MRCLSRARPCPYRSPLSADSSWCIFTPRQSYCQMLVYSLPVSLSQLKNVIKYLRCASACSKLFTFITRRLYSSRKSCEADRIVMPFPRRGNRQRGEVAPTVGGQSWAWAGPTPLQRGLWTAGLYDSAETFTRARVYLCLCVHRE